MFILGVYSIMNTKINSNIFLINECKKQNRGEKMRRTYSEMYEGMELKIESKRLQSGKCQVKFYVSGDVLNNLYGYTLVDSKATLKQVVSQIKVKLSSIKDYSNYYQQGLFSIGKIPIGESENFMIFKN